ncbi:MAG: hypothetical protein ACQEXJ_06950 [Myxococcota bacterium]
MRSNLITRTLLTTVAALALLAGCKDDPAPAPVEPAATADAPAEQPAGEAEQKAPTVDDTEPPTPAADAAEQGAAESPADAEGQAKADVSDDRQAQEAVIAEAIQAALEEDEAKGWRQFEALLHSGQKLAPHSLQNWREFNFSSFRRKVDLYVKDDAEGVAFEVVRVDELPGDRVKLFIRNEKSSPTPCTVKKDPEADGAWRIHNCSL